MLDLVITGGAVVDGTGAPARGADVGIRDGRIVAVGAVDEPARRRLDAGGQVVAPGIIDLHTHYDAQLSWDPAATPSCFHGVTTVIGGNCGFTLAPAGADNADYLMRLMARVEGMPLEALAAGLSWDWTSYADWLGRFDGNLAVNAGFLCGHSALRRHVMGADSVGTAASPEQILAMENLLHGAIAAGALGFSSSQTPNHNDGDGRPIPSRAASREECLRLAAVIAEHPGTTLEWIFAGAVNGFDEAEVELMTSLSLAADRPLNWNALGIGSGDAMYLHQLEASDIAAARGASVLALTVPHLVRLRLSLATGFIFDGLPGWADTMALPIPERCRALSDRDVRHRLAAGVASPEAGMLRALVDWENVAIVEVFTPGLEDTVGRTGGELAKERGTTAFDALLDVAVADGLRTGLAATTLGDDDETWRRRAEVWSDPRVIIGASDAGAHMDLMCGAEYSSVHLGVNVRDRSLLPLEQAVRQLTDIPARLYGLRQRGRIAEGYHADVMVFDPATIDAGPTHTRQDLPGGCSRLYADAIGVSHVMVNGTPIVEAGELTGDQPGTVLRSGQASETVPAGTFVP